jgi:MFS family permease
VQVLTALVLAWFGVRPGEHGHAGAEPHPAVYTQLLNFVRVLLPVAFMFLSALAPYLPRVGSRMGFSPEWSATLPAGWMAWRVVTFFALERLHGWHGRWWTPMLGVASLLVGFGVVVLTPTIVGPGTAGVGLLLAGLGVFGVGVGIIYCAALYYAMEVGAAEVDAGGTHEMLIGVGYSVGPACGLAGLAVTGTVALGSEQIMLVLVSVLALVATGAAMSQAQRAARQRRGEPTSTTARAA